MAEWPLHRACYDANVDAVQRLLLQGAVANSPGVNVRSPLECAVDARRREEPHLEQRIAQVCP